MSQKLYDQLIEEGIYTSGTPQITKFLMEFNRLVEQGNGALYISSSTSPASTVLTESIMSIEPYTDFIDHVFSVKHNIPMMDGDDYEKIDYLSRICTNILLHGSLDRGDRDHMLIISTLTDYTRRVTIPIEYYFHMLMAFDSDLDIFTIQDLSLISQHICVLYKHNINFMKSSNYIIYILNKIAICCCHKHRSSTISVSDYTVDMYKAYVIAYGVSSDTGKQALLSSLLHKQAYTDEYKKLLIQIVELGECLSQETYERIYHIEHKYQHHEPWITLGPCWDSQH